MDPLKYISGVTSVRWVLWLLIPVIFRRITKDYSMAAFGVQYGVPSRHRLETCQGQAACPRAPGPLPNLHTTTSPTPSQPTGCKQPSIPKAVKITPPFRSDSIMWHERLLRMISKNVYGGKIYNQRIYRPLKCQLHK